MYLGLDLRGGVHFLLQVDMKQALTKRLDTTGGDLRSLMREKNVRHAGISRSGDSIEVRFRDEDTRGKARNVILDGQPNLELTDATEGSDLKLVAVFKPAAAKEVLDTALKQNITTLHNRVNELGVAEPVIQQQGADRIVVQLPGVQDTAKAKDILGRTATLEARLVDGTAEAQAALMGSGPVPFGSELFKVGRGAPVVLRKQVIFSGEQLTGAQATFDENQRAAVGIQLNDGAGRVLRDVSRENIKKPMAVVLFERGKGEVLTVATIQAELGSRFQITGMDSPQGANDLALLLRAGALAAPMEIIEERTIGPSLGADNISKGFNSTMYGFIAIAAFMLSYYLLFGLFSTTGAGGQPAAADRPALAAAGHADAARHRRHGAHAGHGDRRQRADQRTHPRGAAQRRAAAGRDRDRLRACLGHHSRLQRDHADRRPGAAGVRIRRGARLRVVHCLGIMTSIFSAVFVSRGIVNLWYGRQKKLRKVSIGQVWKRVRLRLRDSAPTRRLLHGILPHQARHPVHAARAGVQRDLAGHVHRSGRISRDPRAALLDRVHRRHGDGGGVSAGGRTSRRSATTVETLGFTDAQVQNFGTARDVMIRLPLRKGESRPSRATR
jgi:preprotein translocase subunit SecD